MRRVLKNFLFVLGGDLARRVLGFFAVAYLARKIGTDGFGMVNIGFAVLSYALMAGSAGLHSLGTREIARGASEDIVGKILGLRFTLSIVALILSMVVLLLVNDRTLALLIFLFNIALIPDALYVDWYFQGKEEMQSITPARVASAVVYTGSLLLLVRSMADIRMVGICVVLGDVTASVGFMIPYVRRNGLPKIRIALSEWGTLLKQSVPMAAGTILGSFSINFATIAIGYYMTNADVGIYSAASKLVFFLLMFDRVIATLLLPASARLHTRGNDDFAERLRVTLKWIVIIALSSSLGTVLIADRIIVFIYGSQYLASGFILQIGIWYFFFTLLHTVYTSGLIAIGKERLYSTVMTGSTVLYVLTIVAGIKLFGIAGAVGGIVFSEAVTLVVMQMMFSRFIRLSVPPALFKILLSAAGMVAVVLLLSGLPVLLIMAAGSATYAGLLFLTRAVTKEEVLSLVRQTA